MTHASVFSGIGGPEVAATMLGWENLFHCEINPFGRAVLDYWYPNAKSYEDITKTDFSEWRGRIDVLTGGFPCQPFSYAGQRRGQTDDRYLWPYMFRCIDQVRPTWVVAENVAGILTMVEQGEVSQVAGAPTLFDEGDALRGQYRLRETFTLERICRDLESHGYSVQPVLIPACSVGAPHRRDRVFIIGRRRDEDTLADTDNERLEGMHEPRSGEGEYGNGIRRDGAGHGGAAEEGRPTAHAEARPHAHPDGVGSTPQGQGAAGDRPGADHLSGQTRRGQGHPPLRHHGLPTIPRDDGDVADTNRKGLERTASERVQRHEGRGQYNGVRERTRSSCEAHQTRVGTDGTITERGAESIDGRNATDPMYSDVQNLGDVSRGMGETDSGWKTRGLVHESLQNGEEVCGQRWANFPSVSPVHRGNDGIPFPVDSLTLPFSKWRTEALKAYGNAIVPQVMYEIFRAIEQVSLGQR